MKIGKLAAGFAAAAVMGTFGSAFGQSRDTSESSQPADAPAARITPPTPAPNIPDQEQPTSPAGNTPEPQGSASAGGSTVPSVGSTESSPSSDASVSSDAGDKPGGTRD